MFSSLFSQCAANLSNISLRHLKLYTGSSYNALQPIILQHYGQTPLIAQSAFVAPGAYIIGNVTIGSGSSIFYGCVLRGDVNKIVIGSKTNIQDMCVIHVAKNNPKGQQLPTIIGDNVTVGHRAVIHAATLQDNCLIGIGATILDGAVVESGAMVAAHALVTPGTVVKSGEIWAGSPAKYLRYLRENESMYLPQSAEDYYELSSQHKKDLIQAQNK